MQRFSRFIARQHRRVPPRLAFGSWRDALPAAVARARPAPPRAGGHARVPAGRDHEHLRRSRGAPSRVRCSRARWRWTVCSAHGSARALAIRVYSALYRNSGSVNGTWRRACAAARRHGRGERGAGRRGTRRRSGDPLRVGRGPDRRQGWPGRRRAAASRARRLRPSA